MKNNFKNIALIMILSIILLFTISLSTNSKVYANPKNSVSVEEQNKTKNSKSKQENLKKQNTTDEKKHISKQKIGIGVGIVLVVLVIGRAITPKEAFR
ncbi:hypothetical protein IRP63_09555 [Clostridium botulinum]|uniref:Uncharacterized protein n=1 Tax=Clostridium botulinum C/D str. DC5 TaxID=1443128 RepID=A0A0A0IMQ1_CLOBO|nr:hypothetical protein [Clostridium botulinum]KEI04622.1 hypothetical protein Z952_06555 [Clostridium botulinum C/D str. BKT75002]KEI06075.1 hypothetical protein Z954_05540 [Clostridium botulinum C/D str. BKT2873]KGM93718.1 hypothetical protein Z956_10370 [Clostridium botulinum D str. CCUG 7971]KGN01477.1 hypothetical protein Z955_01140 [Clostridium botulinum C/D str. DC5]KOC49796.1 hypothetical protein ADU88_04900 [Clostridium botulinum]